MDDELRTRLVVGGVGEFQASMTSATAAFDGFTNGIVADYEKAGVAATVAGEKMAVSGRRGLSEFTQARMAMRGLGEEVGVHVPRYLNSFLASVGGVAPVMAAAFSGIAIVGLIELVVQAGTKIVHFATQVGELSAAEKKAYEDTRTHLEEALKLRTDSVKAEYELRIAGAKGPEQERLKIEYARALVAINRDNLAAAQQMLSATNAQVKVEAMAGEMRGKAFEAGAVGLRILGMGGVAEAAGWLLAKDAMTAASDASAKMNEEERKNLAARLKAFDELQAAVANQKKAEGKESEDAGLRVLDAETKLAEAEVALTVATVKREYDENKISLDARERAEIDAQTRLLEIHKRALMERARLTGKGGGVDLAKAEETQAIETSTRVLEIQARTEKERLNLAAATGKAILAGRKEVADAEAHAVEVGAKAAYEARRIGLDQEIAAEKTAETQRYQARLNELMGELDLARKAGPAQVAQIIILSAQIEALTKNHQTALEEIEREGQKKRAEEARKQLETRLVVSTEAADLELREARATEDGLLRTRKVGYEEWARVTTEALNRWRAEQISALDSIIAAERTANLLTEEEYLRLAEKKHAIDERWRMDTQKVQDDVARHFQMTVDRMTGPFNREITSVLVGYQTLQKGMVAVESTMLGDLATFLLKRGEKWLAHFLLVDLLHLGSQQKQVMNEAVAAAEKHVVTSTANVATVVSEAAVAAATAYAAYAAFPPVAAAMAAEALASVLAFAPMAAMEKGGIMPATNIALLHKDEMVLPAPLSAAIQKMAAGGGPSSTSTAHIGIEYKPTLYGTGTSGFKRLLRGHSDELAEIVSGLVRSGKLSAGVRV